MCIKNGLNTCLERFLIRSNKNEMGRKVKIIENNNNKTRDMDYRKNNFC
jgi:hypothetical protein